MIIPVQAEDARWHHQARLATALLSIQTARYVIHRLQARAAETHAYIMILLVRAPAEAASIHSARKTATMDAPTACAEPILAALIHARMCQKAHAVATP